MQLEKRVGAYGRADSVCSMLHFWMTHIWRARKRREWFVDRSVLTRYNSQRGNHSDSQFEYRHKLETAFIAHFFPPFLMNGQYPYRVHVCDYSTLIHNAISKPDPQS